MDKFIKKLIERLESLRKRNINECCQKKRKTAGGYIWEFVI